MQALENSRDWPSCLAQSLARALRGIVTIVTVVALSGCSSQEIDVWRLEERAAFDPDAAAHPGGPVDFQSIPISTTLPAIYTIARSWSEQDFIDLTRAFDTSRHRSTPSSLRVWRLRLEQSCIQVGARPDLFSIDWFAPLPTTGNRIDRVYIVNLRKGLLSRSEREKYPDSANYTALRSYSPGVTYAQALSR